MSGTPWWQRQLIAADRAVAHHERAINQDDDLALMVALIQTAKADLARRAEWISSGLLHLLNLPARSDVNRLLVQVASLERQLRELTKGVANQDVAQDAAKEEQRHVPSHPS